MPEILGLSAPSIDIVNGLLMATAGLLVIVSARFLVAYAVARDRNDGIRRAVNKTGRWSYGLIAGLFTAASMGLVQAGDILATVVEFIVGHPYFVSNFGVAGLGAGALSGTVQFTASQYLGVAAMIVGAVFIAVEVDDAI